MSTTVEYVRLLFELDEARRWLDDIEKAAGFGPLDQVAAHQRGRGLAGDHEKRLRTGRIKKIIATVIEESEWRHQVLGEHQAEMERLRAELDEARQRIEAVAANFGKRANRLRNQNGQHFDGCHTKHQADTYEVAAGVVRRALTGAEGGDNGE